MPTLNVRPSAHQIHLLHEGFAARHGHRPDGQLIAGANALAIQLTAGSLWSDALIAAERAVAGAPEGISRRRAQGRRPIQHFPVWLLVRLSEARVGIRRQRLGRPLADDTRASITSSCSRRPILWLDEPSDAPGFDQYEHIDLGGAGDLEEAA